MQKFASIFFGIVKKYCTFMLYKSVTRCWNDF